MTFRVCNYKIVSRKEEIMLLLILTVITSVPLLSNICNSAGGPQETVVIHADCSTFNPSNTVLTLFYSTDNQQSWQNQLMSLVGQPGYESTYATTITAPNSGNVYYYIRAENPLAASTLSPFNSENTWPVPMNLLALGNNDPTGDAQGAEGNWLDLTGLWVGYSQDRFYVLLTNNHNSWPLYSFPQPWYIYSAGFVNPEAPSDSYAFALCYANIPAVFTSGLYLINLYTGDFSRIADIELQTNGNRLYLRTLINDLVSHPKFGPWPNNTGYLAVAANTQSVYPIGGNYVRDTIKPIYFYAGYTPVFRVEVNRSPVLSNPTVQPRVGTPEINFLFSVQYADEDNNLPVERLIVIDDTVLYEMIPTGHRYRDGVPFRWQRAGFGAGWHRFYFRFNDGLTMVTSPLDSFYVGLQGISSYNQNVCRDETDLTVFPAIFNNQVRLITNGDEIVITNSTGRIVRRLLPSSSIIIWDGKNQAGNSVPPGVYLISARKGRSIKTVTVVKIGN